MSDRSAASDTCASAAIRRRDAKSRAPTVAKPPLPPPPARPSPADGDAVRRLCCGLAAELKKLAPSAVVAVEAPPWAAAEEDVAMGAPAMKPLRAVKTFGGLPLPLTLCCCCC